LPDRFYEIYAVDADKHWQGAVPLDVLLRSRRPVPLADLVDEDRRRVSVLDDQEEVARMFGKYNLVAAPVVDTTNRLVGVITIDDVVDVIEEEADEDLKALGGVTSDEELSDSVWTIARGRFNWLLVNLAPRFWRPPCSACSRASSSRWWRWRCWRRSSPARAAMPRPRP
jgi:Mg/Co/Ni transporter MgtE (contains CBS domain)